MRRENLASGPGVETAAHICRDEHLSVVEGQQLLIVRRRNVFSQIPVSHHPSYHGSRVNEEYPVLSTASLEIGTVAGWVTAISSTGIFIALSTIIVALVRRGVSMRGLSNADEADIRDHYAEELARVVDRQHKCEEREHRLRERVAELENDILGLIRIITQASADKVLDLGAEVPKHISDMAERVKHRAFQARESDKPLG